MKVAAYQAPLASSSVRDVIALIREQVACCESAGVEILCCPEAVLGGLADYADRPKRIAISRNGGQLHEVLAVDGGHGGGEQSKCSGAVYDFGKNKTNRTHVEAILVAAKRAT